MDCFRSVVMVKQMGISFKRHVHRLMWRLSAHEPYALRSQGYFPFLTVITKSIIFQRHYLRTFIVINL